MSERRKEPRRLSLLGATVLPPGGRAALDGVVRNISESGALIVFPHAALTPAAFDLALPQRGATHAAAVMWRRGDQAGLALGSAEQRAADPHVQIRKLKRENRRLRRMAKLRVS